MKKKTNQKKSKKADSLVSQYNNKKTNNKLRKNTSHSKLFYISGEGLKVFGRNKKIILISVFAAILILVFGLLIYDQYLRQEGAVGFLEEGDSASSEKAEKSIAGKISDSVIPDKGDKTTPSESPEAGVPSGGGGGGGGAGADSGSGSTEPTYTTDLNICQNAQSGDLCGGLDITYGIGYQAACCSERSLCC